MVVSSEITSEHLQAAYERGIAAGLLQERKRWEEAIRKMTATSFQLRFQNTPPVDLKFGIQWHPKGNELIATVSMMGEK